MNRNSEVRNWKTNSPAAFTLIELLVVIAIIAALAAMLFAAMPAINRSKVRAVARAELTQIASAIENYKSRFNSYPPDNVANSALNPLYFELSGMVLKPGNTYQSLDGSYSVSSNAVWTATRASGFVNSATSAQGSDDHPALENFIKTLKPGQIGTNNGVRILICSADDSPWNYRSTNPTNNTSSFDLWVDIVAGGTTSRIANWNK